MDTCIDKVAVLKYNALPADDPIVGEVLSNLEESQGNGITIKEVMESIQLVASAHQTIIDLRAFDKAVGVLFGPLDLKDGVISRASVRQSLLRNKGTLHQLIQQEPICSAIMKSLEEVSSGLISKEDLRNTIIDVSEANGRSVGQAQANALVNVIFNAQNASK